MAFDIDHWQARLQELAAEHQVPGASFAALIDGSVHVAATGVLNVGTGVEATTDSVFQIGSITKIYTATMILQLVDEGLVELDAPILRYLPDLQLSSPGLIDDVTVRNLLTHTSGIDGDYFFDGGRGDDALRAYVASCSVLGMTHPVGATMSYCNTGFSLLGAIIERVTGSTWDAALRNRIIDPLGLEHTVSLPEDAIRFRVAYGHGVGKDGNAVLAPTWALARSVGPAGGITATAADVVAFARSHLSGGQAGADRILSEPRAAEMLERQVQVPDAAGLGARHIGLAWLLRDWNGRTVYGHDGGTIGQSSYLRIVPDAGVVLCLLTNGGGTQQLYQQFFTELLAASCDVLVPAAPEPPATPVTVNPEDYVGVYQRRGERLDVVATEQGLRATITVTAALSETIPDEVAEASMIALQENFFVTRFDDTDPWTPLTFYATEDGTRYLHQGGRACRKVE